MSKKRRKQKKINENVRQSQEIIEDMLTCGSCADAGTFKMPEPTGLEKIEYLMKVLPGINYIQNMFVDYIFSDGLTTGSIEQDRILNNFLFKKNMRGNTNLDVLRDVIGGAAFKGETGLRWYQGDLYEVKCGTYGALVAKDTGIVYPALYFCTKDESILGEVRIDVPDYMTIDEFEEIFERQKLIPLDKSEFVNIRNKTDEIHGESPLLSDKLRIDLLAAAYSRLNYDVRYDGPGRLILRPKDGYVSGDVNEVDTSTVVKQSVAAGANRLEKAKKEAARVGEEIKNSSSDEVILLSNAFDKEITHLERVTKATEFFDWMSNEGEIIAQAIGMSPALLELGKVSGNVSMERIIDNAMKNTIVPLREKFADQFSALLSEKLGIEKVYFGKYQPASAPDRETMRTKVAEIMTMLNSIEMAETKQLVKDFARMISYDIHNSDGSLVELSVGSEKSGALYDIEKMLKESKR